MTDADVIVVGAGPAGSTAAYHLARHGLTVLVLEKSQFPREKVCGDGLTPRAVKQLVKMGVDTDPAKGWLPNKGLRVIGGGVRLELDWPELAAYPSYGLTRTRLDFDQILADKAVEAGAVLKTRHTVTGPILDDDGRVVGVKAVENGGNGNNGNNGEGNNGNGNSGNRGNQGNNDNNGNGGATGSGRGNNGNGNGGGNGHGNAYGHNKH